MGEWKPRRLQRDPLEDAYFEEAPFREKETKRTMRKRRKRRTMRKRGKRRKRRWGG